MMWLLLWYCRNCGTNSATTCFMPKFCVKISDTVIFVTPRSASSSCTVSHRSWLTAARTHSTFAGVLLVAGLPEQGRPWITLNRFFTFFEAFVLHFYLCFTHCIVPESLLNHLNSFCGGIFKLNAKFDADSLLYSLSHFECKGHTVHVLTQ